MKIWPPEIDLPVTNEGGGIYYKYPGSTLLFEVQSDASGEDTTFLDYSLLISDIHLCTDTGIRQTDVTVTVSFVNSPYRTTSWS